MTGFRERMPRGEILTPRGLGVAMAARHSKKPKPESKKATLARVRAEYRAEEGARAQLLATPLASFVDYLRTGR